MRVASLHIYPVKGVRAVDCAQATVAARGLKGDRRWVIADPTGGFFSQRNCPALAQIKAVVTDDCGLTLEHNGKVLEVTAPSGRQRNEVTVWNDVIDAADAGDAAARWLSDIAGRDARLYFMDKTAVRNTSGRWAQSAPVSFADGYPCLITSRASLDALNKAIEDSHGEAVPMARFRPNIVLEDCDPWAEDFFAVIQVGKVVFDVISPCVRCEVTTRDQMTGDRMDKEPLKTLSVLRRSAHPEKSGVIFGWNAIVRAPGDVAVGDSVRVLEQRPEGWPLA